MTEPFRIAGTICLVLLAVLLVAVSSPERSSASVVHVSPGLATSAQPFSPVQKADIFRDCQRIHWCGTRRDGTPYCGPTLRCRTCKFTRTCTRALGCVWSEKCRWGPYVPPLQQ